MFANTHNLYVPVIGIINAKLTTLNKMIYLDFTCTTQINISILRN